MARDTFIDPNNVRDDYEFDIGHSDEDSFGKTRNIEHSALTGTGTGLVRQQTDSTPLQMSFRGAILHKSQVEEMIAWWELCETQTIHYLDFANERYEVVITSFVPTRHRTIRNPRDFANAPRWYWKYELKMEVIRVISGVWEGVTP